MNPRQRRYVAPGALLVCRPLLAHDSWREAYILRGVGGHIGPVLRADRRRRRVGDFAGPERRGATSTEGHRRRVTLVALPLSALIAAVLAVALFAGGHSPHVARAASANTPAASSGGPATPPSGAATPVTVVRHRRASERTHPVRRRHPAAVRHRRHRTRSHHARRHHTVAPAPTVSTVATTSTTSTVASSPTDTVTQPTPTYTQPTPVTTSSAPPPTSPPSAGHRGTGTVHGGTAGHSGGGGSGTVSGGG